MPGPADFLESQRAQWEALGPAGAAAYEAAAAVLQTASFDNGAQAGTALARALEQAEAAATAAGTALRGLDLLRAVAAALAGTDTLAAALGGGPGEFEQIRDRYLAATLGGPKGATRILRRVAKRPVTGEAPAVPTPSPPAGGDAPDVAADPAASDAPEAAEAAEAAEAPAAPPGPMAAVVVLADALAQMPMIDARYARGLRDVAAGEGDEALIAALNAVDRLVAEHPEPGFAPLWDAAGDAQAQLIDALDENYEVLPGIDNDPGELRQHATTDPGLCVEKRVPHSDPDGTLVAVHRRALRKGSERIQSAGLLVSGGGEAGWQKLLRKGREGLSQAPAAQAAAAAAARTKLARLEQSPPPDAQAELRLLRFAANALAALEREPHVRPVVDKIVGKLRDQGIRDFTVTVGDRFTEKHSASKFERRLVASDRPKGEVVGVLQRGFVDRQGTPLQKAVVQVSKGKS